MRSFLKIALLGLAMSLCFGHAAFAKESYETIEFVGNDMLKVTADYYENPTADFGKRTMVILFHQAGSSRGEYRKIAPKLLAAGVNCLAVDLRSGGPGKSKIDNETANRAVAKNLPVTYTDAYQDMEAALRWVKDQKFSGPVVIWGSSYSSSLVFKLAKDHADDVSAVLAFSPGEYFPDESVASWAGAVDVPVYVTCGEGDREKANAKPIFDKVSNADKVFFQSKGQHGSSMLDDHASNWKPVLKFLKPLINVPAAVKKASGGC